NSLLTGNFLKNNRELSPRYSIGPRSLHLQEEIRSKSTILFKIVFRTVTVRQSIPMTCSVCFAGEKNRTAVCRRPSPLHHAQCILPEQIRNISHAEKARL